jgi:hypothetical protein
MALAAILVRTNSKPDLPVYAEPAGDSLLSETIRLIGQASGDRPAAGGRVSARIAVVASKVKQPASPDRGTRQCAAPR